MHNKFKLMAAALLVGTVALTGCKNKKDEATSTVPPPSDPPPAPVVTTLPPPPAPAPAAAPAARPVPTMEPAPAPQPIPKPNSTPKAASPAHATGGNGAAHAGGTYTVQKGDTLYSIARKVYNDPKKVDAILKANPGIDANKIKVGQKIHLP